MFVRKLNRDDWQAYKALRLEALGLHAGVYGNSFETEASWDNQAWSSMLDAENIAVFGLYDGDVIVGSGVVFTDRGDATGQTALLAGAYIRKEYRGNGYSHLLYEQRMQWIMESGCFKRVLVGHKDGNEASRRANQAFGFEFIGTENKNWGDGSQGIIHQYEVRLT